MTTKPSPHQLTLNINGDSLLPVGISSARRTSISSLASQHAYTATTSSRRGSAACTPTSAVAASPHDVLLFNPEVELSFAITQVIQILIESPIKDSRAPAFVEMRVKIADADRDTYIKAAEMTASMQATLKRLSSDEVRAKYRVTRSDEAGSRGLFDLVKTSSSRAGGRPKSLQIAAGASGFGGSGPSLPFAGLKTPGSRRPGLLSDRTQRLS